VNQQEVQELNLKARSSADITWHSSTASGRAQSVTSVVRTQTWLPALRLNLKTQHLLQM